MVSSSPVSDKSKRREPSTGEARADETKPTNDNDMTTTTTTKTTVAAIYAPGKALFGDDLLDLTGKAWDRGINLSGADLRKAWPADGGGVWIDGACENKHYNASGNIEN